MADISSIRTLFEAVESLAESCQGQKAGQIDEWKSGVTVIYEDQSEHEVLSVRFSLEDLPEGVFVLETLTAFNLILKVSVIENLDDLERVELYYNTKRWALTEKRIAGFWTQRKLHRKSPAGQLRWYLACQMTTAVRWRLTAQKNFGFMKRMSRILSVPLQKNYNDRKIP